MPGSRSLLRFLAPVYWPAWCLIAWLRFAAALPVGFTLGLHKAIGRVAGRMLGPGARTARRNLELCFPELGRTEIEALLRRHYESLGACIAETGLAWFASPERLSSLLEVEGREHLERALAKGRGVLLYTGHFTPLEMTGPLLAAVTPQFAFMYSHRSNALLDEIQSRRRSRIAQAAFPSVNVRALLHHLKRNAVVWYAADQYFRSPQAVPVQFFHEPAMTNTAISRLARISGSEVLPFSYRRSDDGTRYVLSFEPPLPGFPSGDAEADTRRLVERLESAIRRAPEQYLWGHKRYRGRPAPFANVYARPPRTKVPLGRRIGEALHGLRARLCRQLGGEAGPPGAIRGRLLRGACIGASELVPGFSGGTAAFMLGVHQRLIRAVSRLDMEFVRLLWQRRFCDAFRRIDLVFVAPVVLGMICALFLFSRAFPLPVLVAELPEMTYGLLFGLVCASLVSTLAGVNERRIASYGWLVAGVAIGISISFLPASASDGAPWLFVCGGIAVIAMMMPGLSGALALIVLGQYAQTIDAFQRFDLGHLLPLAAGVAAGGIVFARVVTWLLEHHRQPSMLTMVGVLGGSLLTMWPFQNFVYMEVGGQMRLVSATPYLPQSLDHGVVLGFAMMCVGAALPRVLRRWRWATADSA